MNPSEFIAKWDKAELTERSAAQQHFLDLCELVGHPKPAALDQFGDTFTFERGASKLGGGDGWADVWKKGFFGWEYKGRDKDLDAAYTQLKLYAEALENPPLLVVCDLHTIIVRTNFTNTPTETHTIPLAEIGEPRSLEILRALFNTPEKLKPGTTSQVVTEHAARQIAQIAERLREQGTPAEEVAVFLDRVVFCLFAEDVGLLPNQLFRRVVEGARGQPERLKSKLEELFSVMANGGDYGADSIMHFNGSLFTDRKALLLRYDEIEQLFQATKLDWAAVDASIFGTLFERGLDPAKRSQLGAHYTSREDIESLIEPVVMAPLRQSWDETKDLVDLLLTTGRKQRTDEPAKAPVGGQLTKARNEAQALIRRFLRRLTTVKVLDPACGSGNFLYVTLQKMKDLEKQVIVFTRDRGFTPDLPEVGPWQLYGIEVNRYAHDLAQMVVWIGYLQWIRVHGLGGYDDPVLRATNNIQCRDAILDLTGPEAQEAVWPSADFIIGNPPFLGGKKLRSELGDLYVGALFEVYRERVPAEADLCCYWFEKARAAVQADPAQRAGLLATQAIRGGANRRVLERIKTDGEIFFAIGDRNWVLDGAAVHVSMVGFGKANLAVPPVLDGRQVATINADLSSATDVTRARRLGANIGKAFMGDTKGGAFDVTFDVAREMLLTPNPHGQPNSDVLVPWINGLDVSRRPRDMFVIDFGVDASESTAAKYEAPFQFILENVKPVRAINKRAAYRDYWWIHVEARPGMRSALAKLPRYVSTLTVSKHRLFAWIEPPVLADHQLIAFSLSAPGDFGLLHSRVHETWARQLGTQVRERESGFRYTPTSCFETFPFPFGTDQQGATIATLAEQLEQLRSRWLNPPEWCIEDVFEFPASVNGPWGRLVNNPDVNGLGTARYVRMLPKDDDLAPKLKKRTLTNLYNESPQWLLDAHRALDEAVFAAYGWSPALADDELLAKLLALNLERAAAQGAPADVGLLDDADKNVE